MNITVTLAPSPELLQSLQTLANALKGVNQTTFPIEVPPVGAVLAASEEPAEKPIAKKTKAVQAEDKPQQEEPITIEAIREMTDAKVKAGKRDAIKELIAAFNVPNISSLLAIDYSAFYQNLKAL